MQVFMNGGGDAGVGRSDINAAFSNGMKELQKVASVCTDPNFVRHNIRYKLCQCNHGTMHPIG